MILLDTNLLIRMTRSQDPQAGVARAAIQRLRRVSKAWQRPR